MSQNASSEQTVAVIGFGTAGVNALIALRTSGFAGRIIVFSNVADAPISPILTSHYVAGTKTKAECFVWPAEQLAALDFEVIGEAVEALDAASHTICTAEGSYAYDKCIVASGSAPTLGGFPAIEGYEPLVLSTMADAERMRSAFTAASAQRVLISGTSLVALKIADAALACGCKVTLCGRSEHVLRARALPQVAAQFEDCLVAQGITLNMANPVSSGSLAADGTLEVVFADGTEGTFDAIAVAHGMKPNLGFASADTFDIDAGLVVDSFMHTSAADVFAAGDVAQALDPLSGEKRINAVWKSAAVQGACAGRVAAAELAGKAPTEELACAGVVANNTVTVGQAVLISGGTAAGPDSDVSFHMEGNVACATARDGQGRLQGYTVACAHDVAGSAAYDIAAMLDLRLKEGSMRNFQ